MKTIIHNDRKVIDIQLDFNRQFPFLNLEFFDLSTDALSTHINSGERYPDVLVSDLRESGANGELVIYPTMTIMQLEHTLYDEFGLKAQVFFKSGHHWMRTSLNGYWQLRHKNEKGHRICRSQQESV